MEGREGWKIASEDSTEMDYIWDRVSNGILLTIGGGGRSALERNALDYARLQSLSADFLLNWRRNVLGVAAAPVFLLGARQP